MDFLFWFFLICLMVAAIQDIQRREVDNWLTYFLMLGGTSFLLFSRDSKVILLGAFSFLITYLISEALYATKGFGGGDTTLFFSLGALFVGGSFYGTALNIISFILLLALSGSFYGLFYSGVLYAKNKKKTNTLMKKNKKKQSVRVFFILGFILLLIGVFINISLIILGIAIILLPFLILFAKSLEEVSMVKEISGKEVRLGDWLAHDVKVRDKIIKSDFEGVSQHDLKYLRKVKKMKIKYGIPFVPAFLLAFILYYLLKDSIIGVILSLF